MLPQHITRVRHVYRYGRLNLKYRFLYLRNLIFFWRKKKLTPPPINEEIPILAPREPFFPLRDETWIPWWWGPPKFIEYRIRRKAATEKRWLPRALGLIFGILLYQTWYAFENVILGAPARFPNKQAVLGFQDPATPIMEVLINVHNYILYYLVLVILLVVWLLISIFYEFFYKMYFPWKYGLVTQGREELLANIDVSHGSKLELYWTLFPTIILFLIGIPSFILLYSMETPADFEMTVKVIGHQWYWSYEFNDPASPINPENYDKPKIVADMVFDSNMIYENELSKGEFRLLSVSKALILPTNVNIQLIITSDDVLHSFAVPSLGVKVDGVPGRLNNASIFIKRPGVFYGQCSELCGVNHFGMPIVVKSSPLDEWVGYMLRHGYLVTIK